MTRQQMSVLVCFIYENITSFVNETSNSISKERKLSNFCLRWFDWFFVIFFVLEFKIFSQNFLYVPFAFFNFPLRLYTIHSSTILHLVPCGAVFCGCGISWVSSLIFFIMILTTSSPNVTPINVLPLVPVPVIVPPVLPLPVIVPPVLPLPVIVPPVLPLPVIVPPVLPLPVPIIRGRKTHML